MKFAHKIALRNMLHDAQKLSYHVTTRLRIADFKNFKYIKPLKLNFSRPSTNDLGLGPRAT